MSLANNYFRADHEGSAVIISISAGKFFSFDKIGFEIFDALEQRRVDQLVANLAAKHDAPADVVMLERAQKFLNKLSENELLRVE